MRYHLDVLRLFILGCILAGLLAVVACGPQEAEPTIQGRWEVVEYHPGNPRSVSRVKVKFITFQTDGKLVLERVDAGGAKATPLALEYEVHEKDGQLRLHVPQINLAGTKITVQLGDAGQKLKITFSGRNQDVYMLKRSD